MEELMEVIIVGAGSIGVPTALALAEKKVRVLVIDSNASPGQGDNKHAIGGIRATHGDPAKILTCKRSLEIVSSWKEKYGDDIEWNQGGYSFPCYRQQEVDALKSLLPIQRSAGLEIEFVSAEKLLEVIPGLNPSGLLGGTLSEGDGVASPLKCIVAMEKRAKRLGAEFMYNTRVSGIIPEIGVKLDSGDVIKGNIVLDCAGAYSNELLESVGVKLPLVPDSHEGGVTEPVEKFFEPMVVDLRPGPGSKNFYFYQGVHGHIIFCLTPNPLYVGTDLRETSVFLPQVAKRMVDLIPRLRHLKVRRTWRGLYPMSPDGSPLVGWNKNVPKLFHASAMGGQGFMLGPGLGEIIARAILNETTKSDEVVLDKFAYDREFKGEEALK